MTNQFRIENNLETGEVLEIELTAEEIAEFAILKDKVDAERQTEAAKAHERSLLLAKLGITEQEAQLLLGGNQ